MAAILRFYHLGEYSFSSNEVTIVMLTKGAMYPVDYFIYPIRWWIMGFFFNIFGINGFSARLGPCIFGIATIPLMYYFGRDVFGSFEGILSAMILSFSLWHIYWSQNARFYTLILLFSVIAIWAFYKGIEKSKKRFLTLSAVITVIALLTNFSVVWLIASCITYYFYAVLSDKQNNISLTDFMKYYGITFGLYPLILAISLIPSLPMIPKLSASEGIYKLVYGVSWVFSARYGPPPEVFIQSLLVGVGISTSILAFSAILYLLKERDRRGVFLSLIILVPLLILLYLPGEIKPRYIFYILPAPILAASHGIHHIYTKLRGYPVIWGTLIVMVAINGLGIDTGYCNEYYKTGDREDMRGACRGYVKENFKENDSIGVTGNRVKFYMDEEYPIFSVRNQNGQQRVINSKGRVWVMDIDNRFSWLPGGTDFRSWLDKNCMEKKEFQGVVVYLVE